VVGLWTSRSSHRVGVVFEVYLHWRKGPLV
jgi:hypothetical protein